MCSIGVDSACRVRPISFRSVVGGPDPADRCSAIRSDILLLYCGSEGLGFNRAISGGSLLQVNYRLCGSRPLSDLMSSGVARKGWAPLAQLAFQLKPDRPLRFPTARLDLPFSQALELSSSEPFAG